jgi:hypothetical protein
MVTREPPYPGAKAQYTGPMGRLSRTMQLARASWEVLKADKELLILPLLSLLATSVVAASFLVPVIHAGRDAGPSNPGPVGGALIFAAYLLLAFITIFFNAALVHAANQRLEGGDPTVRSALAGASRRMGRILPWALLSATVSVVLRAIQERGGIIGKIVSGIAGIAWSLVTFMVVPVLVFENVGVGDALRRSSALFRKTWGENVAAQVGFGLLGFLLVLPAVAVIALAFAVGATFGAFALIAGVLWILLVSMVLSALSGIFQTALYRYASGNAQGVGAFSATDLQAAFAPKR